MRALVTGGAGFAGTHLAKHLVECRDDVALTYLPSAVAGADSPGYDSRGTAAGAASREQNAVQQLELKRRSVVPPAVQHIALDVTKEAEVRQVLSLMQPDVIYHLAAMSFIPEAEEKVLEAFQVNAFGTMNLLKAVKEVSPSSRVLYVSTSEVYGIPRPASLPLTEQAEVRPLTSYAVTKAAGENFAYKYSARDGLFTVIVRPFPHVGPYQEDRFSLSSFAKQIALIKVGRKEAVIEVGNVDVKRDFSDVSDIVRGYREAILNGRAGEAYNLCAGTSYPLIDLIKRMLVLSNVEAEIEVASDRVRASDIPEHVGSSAKAARDFGWKPRVEVDAMLGSLLAYWLEAVSI